MNDLIAECAENSSKHAEFVGCVNTLTKDWEEKGLISGKERGAIKSCASKSDIP